MTAEEQPRKEEGEAQGEKGEWECEREREREPWSGYYDEEGAKAGTAGAAGANNNTSGPDTREAVGRGLRDIVAGIQGAGDALRGTVGANLDEAFGKKEGVERNRAIAQRGKDEMERVGMKRVR